MSLPSLHCHSTAISLTINFPTYLFYCYAAAIIIYYMAHRTAAPCNRQPELSDMNISAHVFYEFYISGTATEYNKDLCFDGVGVCSSRVAFAKQPFVFGFVYWLPICSYGIRLKMSSISTCGCVLMCCSTMNGDTSMASSSCIVAVFSSLQLYRWDMTLETPYRNVDTKLTTRTKIYDLSTKYNIIYCLDMI